MYHPTCKYWNEEDGKEKLKKIIRQSKEPVSFSKYSCCSKEKIKSAAPEGFTWIEPGQKRFVKGKTTMRMYENAEGVYEFAAHIIAGENKVGAGYNAEIQSIWVWNYDTREYIRRNEMKNYKGRKELYLSVCEMAEKL